MVTLGAMPTTSKLNIEKNIDCWKNFGVKYFLERRELGIINIGAEGTVFVENADNTTTEYDLGNLYGLYHPMGTKKVEFTSKDATKPAKFYMCSAPAHKAFSAKLITLEDAAKKPAGSPETANKRVMNQYIHPAVLETCQLSMGCTTLERSEEHTSELQSHSEN